MKVGREREIEVLIAEKIMKWHWEEQPPKYEKEERGRTLCPPGKHWHPWGWAIPKYSRDISAAWEVVEKMRLLGWHYLINYLDDGEYTRVHHAAFLNQIDFSDIFHAYADTAPLTICLAALNVTENPHKPL